MPRDEDLLEGYHDDPNGEEVLISFLTILWTMVLVAFWLVYLPFRLIRWAYRALRTARHTPQHRQTEEKPHVWREGY